MESLFSILTGTESRNLQNPVFVPSLPPNEISDANRLFNQQNTNIPHATQSEDKILLLLS